MATLITVLPATRLTLAKARDLTKQKLILEILNTSPGDPNLANVKAAYERAVQLYPATMALAAAILANDNTFTLATLDGFGETSAP